MKIIDAHAHIFDNLRGFGKNGEMRAVGNGYGAWANGDRFKVIPDGYGDTAFTAESLLKIMEENNVEKAVLLQGSLYGFMNDYVMETVKKYDGKFVGACTFDPYCGNAKELYNRFTKELGYTIIKFEFSAGAGLMGYHSDFKIDGENMVFLWEDANKNGYTVVLDVGSPGMESYQLDRVISLAKKYKNVQIVICHLFAPTENHEEALKESLTKTAQLDNIAYDFSSLTWNVKGGSYPYPLVQKFIKIGRDIVGTDKLMFGTDTPCVLTAFTYKELVDLVVESGIFNEGELQDVFYNNANRIYFNNK